MTRDAVLVASYTTSPLKFLSRFQALCARAGRDIDAKKSFLEGCEREKLLLARKDQEPRSQGANREGEAFETERK